MMIWRSKKGFTLVELMIVVSIIGLLVAIAVPNFLRARRNTRKNLCINNLRLITHAVEQYQIDHDVPDGVAVNLTADHDGDGFGDIMDADAGSTAYIKRDLTCPEEGTAYGDCTTGTNEACPDVGTYTEHVLS